MQLKTDWFETFLVYFFPLVDAIIDNKKDIPLFKTIFIFSYSLHTQAAVHNHCQKKERLTVVLSHFLIFPSNRGKKTSIFSSFITFFFYFLPALYRTNFLTVFFFRALLGDYFLCLDSVEFRKNCILVTPLLWFSPNPAGNDWPRNSTFNFMIAIV